MGKTSLFNMLCGTDDCVSKDALLCTGEEKEATCNLDDKQTCTVRDTGGFPEEGSESFMTKLIPARFRKSTTKELQTRLEKLVKKKELHLLVYCMSADSRNKRKSHTIHYNMFKSVGVPVVVVVTNLELQDISSESWWSKNERQLKEFGMNSSTRHACVTTLPIQKLTEKERPLHDVSCTKVKALISSNIL
jgi:hypothetical protein